jgi:hypothetical protein
MPEPPRIQVRAGRRDGAARRADRTGFVGRLPWGFSGTLQKSATHLADGKPGDGHDFAAAGFAGHEAKGGRVQTEAFGQEADERRIGTAVHRRRAQLHADGVAQFACDFVAGRAGDDLDADAAGRLAHAGELRRSAPPAQLERRGAVAPSQVEGRGSQIEGYKSNVESQTGEVTLTPFDL